MLEAVAVSVFGLCDTRILQLPTTAKVICDVVVAKQVVLLQYYGPFLWFQMKRGLDYSILRLRCN